MINRYALIVAALTAMWLCSGARAAVVPDLYATQVPVADTTPEAREDAYAAALAKVLTRVTGLRNAGSLPESVALMEQAGAFVQQYTYRADNTLWVAFDGRALEATLVSAKLPLWNRDRPAILVWLAVDRGGGRRSLIGADDTSDIKQQVLDLARERGLPLIWPLLDSQDLAAASASDIWGGFGDKVAEASRRYQPDAVLVGRLRGASGQRLFGTWDFQTGSDTQRWRGGLNDGMHSVADFLVSRLAASASNASVVSVVVSHITDVAAYGATLNYLERLSLVDSLRVVEVRDDTVVFEIELLGDPGRLRRAIDVGRVLMPYEDDDGMSLVFRFAR